MSIESWRRARRRVWGWSLYIEVPEPRESVALREAAQAVIDGASPWAIATKWNQRRDLPTAYGGPWSGIAVQRLLQRTTNTMGPDPPLSEPVSRAVIEALNDPERRNRWRITAAPYRRIGHGKFVSTAVALCGICDAPMSTAGGTSDGIMYVRCSRKSKGDGERHPSTLLRPLEAAVVGALAQTLAEQRAVPVSNAQAALDAMTVFDRRVLAGRHLDVVVTYSYRGPRDNFIVTRKKLVEP